MDWIRMIQNTINYIENHIFDDIDPDEIAKTAYYSAYQFNRAFSMIAGISIGEYIRNRRLSLAGREVRDSKEKVIDIALKYGYDSPESFTKAFTRFHGESPSALRLSSREIRFYSPLTIQTNVKGGFNMSKKLLTDIRDLIEGGKGHNYALPDCIKYIFERVGDYEQLDFWDIAAVTGDTVAQVYNHTRTTSCEYCVSGYLAGAEHIAYVFDIFGYAHEYVTAEKIIADSEKYQRKIVEYIDKGVPVLVKTNLNDIPAWHSDVGTYCLVIGYENDGHIVKLLVSDKMTVDYEINSENKLDLIFIGQKQREASLEGIYLSVIKKMPYWLTLPERNGMYFGAAAYRKWADDIEAGRVENENLPLWENYGVYVCNLATSGGELTYIFKKLADISPKYAGLVSVSEKIQELLPAESPTGGRSLLWIRLEELGGGMDMNAVKTVMRDKEKRSAIAAALWDYAERLDKAVEIMIEINSANKTSMVGSREIETVSVSMEKDSIHKTNTLLWDTKGNEVIGTTALPMYGAFVSEEKLRLFGDVSGKKILEIGCGTGHSLQYVGERKASELWGIDISKRQIEKARQHLKSFGLSAKFVCSPMEEECGIPKNYFDFVYSVYAIGWTTDLDGTFRRIASYLKKDSVFIFSWSHPIHKCVAAENDVFVMQKCYFDESWYSLSLDGNVLALSDRKLSTYVNTLSEAGFVIEQMIEESDGEIIRSCGEDNNFAKKAKMFPVTFVIKARKL